MTEGEPRAAGSAEEQSGEELILDLLRTLPPMSGEVASNAMAVKDQLPVPIVIERRQK